MLVLGVVFRQTPMDGWAATAAEVGDDGLERLAELDVEHGVQDWIHRRVGVTEPEQECVEPARQIGQSVTAHAPGHVDGEKAEPHGAEDADYDGHSHRGAHFPPLAAVTWSTGAPCRLLGCWTARQRRRRTDGD